MIEHIEMIIGDRLMGKKMEEAQCLGEVKEEESLRQSTALFTSEPSCQ